MMKKAACPEEKKKKRLNPSKIASKYIKISTASSDGLGLFLTPGPGCIWQLSVTSNAGSVFKREKNRHLSSIFLSKSFLLNASHQRVQGTFTWNSGNINVPHSAESGKRLHDKEEHHWEGWREAPWDLQHRAMHSNGCITAAVLATPPFKLICGSWWVAQGQFTIRLLGGVWAEWGGRGPFTESLGYILQWR